MFHLIQTAHAAVLPTFEQNQNLGEFIVSIYNFSIALVGLAVFVQFLIAGFTYLTAAGNAGATHGAKEKMQNAILGAILLLASYLILNVINPDLVKTDFLDFRKIAEKMRPPPPKVKTSSAPKTTTSPTLPPVEAP